ncbi:hypothetical protein AAY473_011900 [Plecturocebus cupreus]
MGPAEPDRPVYSAPAKQPRRPKESRWQPVWLLCRESPGSRFVTQAGVLWFDHGLLQLPPSGLKQSFHLTLPKTGSPCVAQAHELLGAGYSLASASPSAGIAGRWSFAMFPRLISNSQAQVIYLPQLPKVLGLQVNDKTLRAEATLLGPFISRRHQHCDTCQCHRRHRLLCLHLPLLWGLLPLLHHQHLRCQWHPPNCGSRKMAPYIAKIPLWGKNRHRTQTVSEKF